MLLPASSCLHMSAPAGSSWSFTPEPWSVPNWLPSSLPRALQCHRSTQQPELSEPRQVRSCWRSTHVPGSTTPPPQDHLLRGVAWLGAAGMEGTLALCLALHWAACASPFAPWVQVVGPAEQPPGALVDVINCWLLRCSCTHVLGDKGGLQEPGRERWVSGEQVPVLAK